jgi:peptide/nickel transport system substrate-binding protein
LTTSAGSIHNARISNLKRTWGEEESEVGSSQGADAEFDKFERFLDEWSRRDFLRGLGGAAAFSAFLVGGAEFLAACGGGSTQTNTQNAVKGGHLVEGYFSDIGNLNPVLVADNVSANVSGRLYEGLLDADVQGNLIPSVATSVPKPSADGLTYTFNMRKDVKFTDGTPVTADDVAFTYQLMYDPKYKDVKSRFRSDLATYVDNVAATDRYTAVIKTKTVYAPFLPTYGTFGILPKHVWEKLSPAEINSTDMNQVPTVVNGAFMPAKWDKGQSYTAKRNPNYFRGPALLDTYIVKVVSDAVALANQLRTGELDVAGQVDPSQWDSLCTAQNVNRVSYLSTNWDYFFFNMDPAKTAKAKIFGDVNVRQALNYAINRQQLADRVYFRQAVPADSPISTVSFAHVSPRTQYPYDLKKAESMLDDAGWKRGADGVRSKDGVRMEWELVTNAGNVARQNVIVVLAEQWKQVGANVATRPIPFQDFVTKLQSTHEFEMGVIGNTGAIDPDLSQLFKTSASTNGLNGGSYSNPEVDKLLDEAVHTLDHSQRRQLYGQFQEIIARDVPSPALVLPKRLWGVSKRVRNWNVGPYNTDRARPWFKDVFVTDGK